MPNYRVYVLDAGLEPVPAGVVGELYIAGVGLARGYLEARGPDGGAVCRRPAWCGGRRFGEPDVPDRGPGAVAVRRRAGVPGTRGRAGEAARVPDRAGRDRGGAAAAGGGVAGRGDRAAGWCGPAAADRLRGGVAGAVLDPSALRQALGRSLPDYMVPSALMVLERLPLTPNGKLDRRALPEPEFASAHLHRAARSPQEAILCSLFAEVLGVERVGIDDNFFELGGHSLLATRLISRIRAALNVEVAIRSLFEAPSVLALSARLQSSETQALRAPLVPAAASGRDPAVLCAAAAVVPGPAGECRRTGGRHPDGGTRTGGTYVIPLAVRLSGGLDRAALEAALCDLVERHESLRTVFPDRLGVPRQSILDASAARPRLEVEAVTEADLPAALAAAVGRGFDLSSELPLRAHLFELAAARVQRRRIRPTEHVLLLLLHHIAGDGWSLGPLSRDLSALYRARCEGRAAALAPLAVQYADYTLWQQAVLGSEDEASSAIARQLAFWTQTLEGPAGSDRAAGRPAAAGGREPSRRRRAAACRRGAAPWSGGAGAGGGREPVHGAAGGAGRAADAARRRHRHRDRQPDRGADRRGAGRSDRVLRQHAGAAHRHLGQPGVPGADRAGAGRRTLRPTAMRICRSSVWWRCSIRRGRCRGTRCSR